MLTYSIIMFLAGILFAGMSIAIYKGNTDLIHDHHQTKVTDKAAYGKAFGKALSVFSAAMFLSGIIGMLGDRDAIATVAVAVLIIGIGIGIGCIVAVQKRYNEGLF